MAANSNPHIQQYWLMPDRVVLFEIKGDLDIDDLRALNATFEQALDEGQAPVHFIIEASGLGNVPKNLIEMRDSMPYMQHKNLGWLFLSGVNPVIKFLANVATNLIEVQFRTVDSVADAKRILQNIDTTITFDGSVRSAE